MAVRSRTGPAKVKVELVPHPLAPMFSGEDREKVFEEVMGEALSGDFSTANEEIRQVLRQAALVSQWFFLKFVAGYSGPYNDLTDHLHVDMCNFSQRMDFAGVRAAAFLPRSTFKSSIFTHGRMAWRITRDPDVTFGLGSGVIDRAWEFLQITERTFDSNDFYAWLFPEFVLDPLKKGVITDKMFVVPNRTRIQAAPTIKPFAVGGSTQGIHAAEIIMDDIVGDAQLDSTRTANADMARIGNWLKSNSRTLFMNPTTGVLMLVGTRYDVDDVYEPVMMNAKSFTGYFEEVDYELAEQGEWDVYYRDAIEYGEPIFPERLSREFLEAIERDDWWTYVTQYRNNPRKSKLAEFVDYRVKECHVDYRGDGQVVVWQEGSEEKFYHVRDLDVVVAVDPAATEKRMSAKTSRSAVVVLARGPKDERFVLWGKADYVGGPELFEWMFEASRRFPMRRATVLEAQGPFKVLVGLLREEQSRRGEWLNLRPQGAAVDKDVRIRTSLEGVLAGGKMRAVPGVQDILNRELLGFPNSLQKDFLDALALAEGASLQPVSRAEEEEWEEEMEMVSYERNPVTGY